MRLETVIVCASFFSLFLAQICPGFARLLMMEAEHLGKVQNIIKRDNGSFAFFSHPFKLWEGFVNFLQYFSLPEV